MMGLGFVVGRNLIRGNQSGISSVLQDYRCLVMDQPRYLIDLP